MPRMTDTVSNLRAMAADVEDALLRVSGERDDLETLLFVSERLLMIANELDADALDDVLTCPECGEEVWDGPRGHKLARCWNTEGHASGGTLAFDTMGDDA